MFAVLACRAVRLMLTCTDPTVPQWLGFMSRVAAEVAGGECAATVRILAMNVGAEAKPGPRIIDAASVGAPGAAAVELLRGEWWQGLPLFDDTRVMEQLAGSEGGVLIKTSAEAQALESWMNSTARQRRREAGLHDFLCAWARAGSGRDLHLVMLELSALRPDWSAPPGLVPIVGELVTAMTIGFTHRFLEQRIRRRLLLEALSPVQRTVVPLLCEGHTERTIARMLGRSAHTIHEHTKAIYLAWRVKNRYEMRDMWLGLGSVSFLMAAERGAR